MQQAALNLPMPRAAVRATLITVLARDHKGRERGVKAEHLAAKLGISERVLRQLISDAREAGVPICGKPETGYYVAATAEELEECCAFLRSRAMHSLRIESRLRNIPLPDLIGQLHLPT